MEQKPYDRLARINIYLAEAVYHLELLCTELSLDKTALRLMVEQLEEVRIDTNCWLTNEVQNRVLQQTQTSRKNWRIAELLQEMDAKI
jgi:hypothetical protein